MDPYYYPMDIRSQLGQYEATTGRYNPAIMESALRARLSAIYEGQRGRKALALQERAQESQESQFGESLGFQRERALSADALAQANLGLTREQLDAQKQAARMSGITQIGTGAVQSAALYGYGKQAGWWGAQAAAVTPAAVPYTAGGASGVGGAAVNMPGASSAGMTSAGLSAYAAPVAGGAVAGYYGAKYGPGRTQDIGGVATLGMGGEKEKKVVGGEIKGAGAGALAGAAIGSVVPGVGTAIGAIVGTVAGALGGSFGGK